MFPDMYVYRDPSATTHPFKFGHDYYMCEKGEWTISRQTLIIQGILLVFVFLFYGDMTKMNVSDSVLGSHPVRLLEDGDKWHHSVWNGGLDVRHRHRHCAGAHLLREGTVRRASFP